MSSVPPDDQSPNQWGDDTGAVPLGPEPEPTGAGGPGGPGGWGEEPRTEPFAVAALVWAIVSIVIPVIGTIVAFVLAQRAADSIRRSQGTRRGEQLVTAARITAGAVLALWAIGLISFFALRSGDSSNSDVAVPTKPPVSTTLAPITTVTTVPLTTTTKPPVTSTTTPPPTVSVLPPPPTAAPTAPPTTPPTTPPTQPVTTVTTLPVTTTTIPDSQKSEILAQKMLAKPALGPSNRGVPNDARFVVDYQAGQVLTVTWAINNGVAPYPTGDATCTAPPTSTGPDTSTTSSTTSTTTSTTTTTLPPGETTPTSAPPAGRTTSQQARYEAKNVLATIKSQITALKLNFTDVQLVGTYPITGAGDDDVVQVLYSHQTVLLPTFNYKKAFDVPPAKELQCLNPAFAD
jgi:hypothetical protein